MKKKWIIPAIIAAVLVVIVSLIAFFPAMLINGMAKEQVKRLDNSYINSNYQGWNEVTFFDEHRSTECIRISIWRVLSQLSNKGDYPRIVSINAIGCITD